MAQSQKLSIQTCWHILSHSSFLTFPLYSSPPLNPPLGERLVNPCLVSSNANLFENAGKYMFALIFFASNSLFPSLSELFNSWTLNGLALLLPNNNWTRFFLFIRLGSPRFSHVFIPFSSHLTDRQTCPPATSLTLPNFIYGPDWHLLHTHSHTQTYCRCLVTWIVLALPHFELLACQSLLFVCWMWIEASLKDTQAVCVCAHHGATLSLCLFNGTFMLCDVATYCLSHLTCLSLYEDLRKEGKK